MATVVSAVPVPVAPAPTTLTANVQLQQASTAVEPQGAPGAPGSRSFRRTVSWADEGRQGGLVDVRTFEPRSAP